jgi:putative transposase
MNCARGKAVRRRLHTGWDVDRVTLYNWKNKLLGREAPASMKRDKSSPEETDPGELARQVETLRREIRNLQLEHDLLKKANELLKKDLGVDLQLLSNREKDDAG